MFSIVRLNECGFIINSYKQIGLPVQRAQNLIIFYKQKIKSFKHNNLPLVFL